MSNPDDQAAPTNDDAQNATAVDASEDLASQLELEPAKSDEPEAKPGEAKEPENPEAPTADEEPNEGEPKADVPKEEPANDEDAKQRRHNYQMAQQRIEQRDKRLIEQKIDQNYQPQPVDQLTQHFIDQGYDEFQANLLARDEARSQREQINEARAQVTELNMRLETEAVQVMHDFPIFDPNSPQYDADFAKRASDMYLRASGAVIDETSGLVVQTNITPYEFYKDIIDMRNDGMTQAQIRAQKAAEQQMASVAPPSSSAPVVHQSKEDKEAADLEAALNAVR